MEQLCCSVNIFNPLQSFFISTGIFDLVHVVRYLFIWKSWLFYDQMEWMKCFMYILC